MAMSVVCGMTLRRAVVLGGVFMAGMVVVIFLFRVGFTVALSMVMSIALRVVA